MQRLIISFLLMMLSQFLQAQTFIDPVRIEVSNTKTVSIVFAAATISIDRGSPNLAVQKSTDNILRVKAEKAFDGETNLTVVTGDGCLFSFIVTYSADPSHLTYNMGKTESVKGDSLIMAFCSKILKLPSNLYGIKYSCGKVSLKLNGFYIHKSLMFCSLRLENRSNIGYDIDQFKIYIKDNKLSKRTSSQENEIIPLYVSGETSAIPANTGISLIAVVPKFTIPDGKHIEVELIEKNGGRHLLIKAYNGQVVLAKELLDFK